MIFRTNGTRLKGVTALTLAFIMSVSMMPEMAAAAGDTYTVKVSSVNIRKDASTDSHVIDTADRGANVEVIGSKGDWYKVKYDGHTGYIRQDMLSKGAGQASSDHSATAEVTGNSVNIRKSASTKADVLKRVSEGKVLEAISISDGWVKVKYDGITGYVSSEYVKVRGLDTSEGSSERLEEMDRRGEINADEVNVRKGAGKASDKLYSLNKGSRVDVTGIKGDWYRVHTSKGTGYVLAKYVAIKQNSEQDSSAEAIKDMDASGVITGSSVNVRADASKSARALFRLSEGAKVSIKGIKGDWYLVKTSKGRGFVLEKYVNVTKDESVSDSIESMQGSAVVTASSVNLREGATTASDCLCKLERGAKVEISGRAGDWYFVKTPHNRGFVMKDFLEIEISPDAAADVLKEGQRGDAVKALQQRLKALGYLSGSADGHFGESTKAAVKAFQIKSGLDADGIAGKTTLEVLNAKDAPTADGTAPEKPAAAENEALSQGSTGESVKKLQKRLIELGYMEGGADGDFGSATTDAIRAFQKQVGMTADGIAGEDTQKALYASDAPSKKSEADRTEAELDSLNSTLKMGDSGDEVAKLQKRLMELKYMKGSADGSFGANTRDAVMLFQKQAGLSVDGKAGKTTIEKLFSDRAEKYDGKTTIGGSASDASEGHEPADEREKSGVIMSDWWKGDIQKKFTRGTIATVTDVRTGLKWKVKRRGGINHADVEPLTAEDTAQMRKAYNGSWSWNRHAIWVTVGGKTYAASMNGMPHAVYSITNNNFPGHHCIHFLNSRTHTGNRLDSDHQAAVRKAYEAGN